MSTAAISLGWSVNRAAGVAALVLASVSILAGTLITNRTRRGALTALPARDRHPLHEALSLATLAAIGLHGAAFAIDGFFKAGVAGALIPFDSPYRPVAVGLGQLAAYGLAAFGLTFYLRRRIGTTRWRVAHRAVALFWLLAVAHALLAGSDVHRLWFLLAVVPVVGAALVSVAQRWLGRLAPQRPTAPDPAR